MAEAAARAAERRARGTPAGGAAASDSLDLPPIYRPDDWRHMPPPQPTAKDEPAKPIRRARSDFYDDSESEDTTNSADVATAPPPPSPKRIRLADEADNGKMDTSITAEQPVVDAVMAEEGEEEEEVVSTVEERPFGWCVEPAGYVVPAEPTVALRVPRPGEDAGPLQLANPLPVFDRYVSFREYPDHKYFYWRYHCDPETGAETDRLDEDSYRMLDGSVTSFISSFHEHFDAPAVAARCAVNPRSAYCGRTVESILEQWNGASTRGTAVHLAIEHFYNGTPQPDEEVLAWPEWGQFLDFHREVVVARGLVPFRTELSMYHGNLLDKDGAVVDWGADLAGQADMLFRPSPNDARYGKSALVKMDWKCTKDISAFSFGRNYYPPVAHARDSKLQKYSYQLGGYTDTVERHTDWRIVEAYLVRFHHTSAAYQLIQVPLTPQLRADVRAMLGVRIAALRAGAAPPPIVEEPEFD